MDLALRPTSDEASGLSWYEDDVLDTIRHAATGTDFVMLGDLKAEMESEPAYYDERFSAFRKNVKKDLTEKGWWISSGHVSAGLAALSFWVVTIAWPIVLGGVFGGEP